MLIEKKQQKDTIATRILTRARDYGVTNDKGELFDRNFLPYSNDQLVDKSRNAVGQSKAQMQYPNGLSPDGFSAFSPTIGMNVDNMDPQRAYDVTAENQVNIYWSKNRERVMKYYRVASRCEVSEALDQIADEAVAKNDLGEYASLWVDPDADIGESVRQKLHKIFRQEVMNKILNFKKDGWYLFRTMLLEGRMFFEVILDNEKGKIIGVSLLPSQNMIVVVQDGIIVGYRQMLEGVFSSAQPSAGRNFIDYSPNQILYADLGMYGPGGINDVRGPLEPAIKPFNQLNSIEDSVVMYRIQWGHEKIIFKIDTGMMPKSKAERHMKEQAKILSRRPDYNTATGEIANTGRVIGVGEHFFISTSNQTQNSEITSLKAGENAGNIEDLKYFKRNLVNSTKVPPGRVSALAGDGENYANGKIGEVTQAEVTFARMVDRYQNPFDTIITRLFVMVLNTIPEILDEVKREEYFGIRFHKGNTFQNYMDSEILNTNLETFDRMFKYVKTKENPSGVLSKKLAFTKGLRMSDEDMISNMDWLEREGVIEENEATGGGGGEPGGGLLGEM